MIVKMELLEDAIFGNGESIPGGEDMSVLQDEQGFPYFRGSSFRGIFKEELINYLSWNKVEKIEDKVNKLFGESKKDDFNEENKIFFSDFHISNNVRYCVLEELSDRKQEILEAFSNIRTFTSIDEDGMTKKGSLRSCRCLNKGLIFWGNIDCAKEDEAMVQDVLSCVKWLGTSRNRGFGKVKVSIKQEVK